MDDNLGDNDPIMKQPYLQVIQVLDASHPLKL